MISITAGGSRRRFWLSLKIGEETARATLRWH